ncbi:MAG: DUF5615 family PIN-like protein [Acidobacteria bacterium]|nr:DUF5615 family PIN-like protein [Acidobacteriota bacterium]MBK9527857.1 DUF5615 family PIN-like protein [Acidobacteriota bacterium]MBP7474942.1 DUF5615 family PIN-like protein [Pyrinomonadaceae bacterium]MBP9109017.1 DUF5615 family PIN-like protein [Pyrinomonadaceae bacterium]
MKILLDHNLDRRLKTHLRGHETSTTQEKGWADVVNGKLLDLAEADGFDVILTADANIKHQQNFSHRSIAILIMRAFNNRLTTHLEMIDAVQQVLTEIRAGEIRETFHTDFDRKG